MHHGDGVEEAFYTTDRVMTVSFHKYGEYFPGTGELRDIGVGQGKHYAVNFPLRDGITDITYKEVFEPVIGHVMEYYRPEAVVLQCGADSLSGDRLGCFNLSMAGHANCVEFVKKFNIPTLVVGGGGYTMRNVSRAWTYETGILVNQKVGPDLPYSDFYEYFGPDYELDVRPSNMENLNSREYLEKIKTAVLANLERTRHAPSVQLTDVGKGLTEAEEENDAMLDDEEEDGPGMDRRHTQRRWDRTIEKDGELMSDSEDEEMENSLGVRSQGKRRRRNESTWKDNSASASGVATPILGGRGGSDASEAGSKSSKGKDDAAEEQDNEQDHNLAEYDDELEAVRKEAEEEAADEDGDVEMGDDAAVAAGEKFGLDGSRDEEMVDATATEAVEKPAPLAPPEADAVKAEPTVSPAAEAAASPVAEKVDEKKESDTITVAAPPVVAPVKVVESPGIGASGIPGLTLAQAAEDARRAEESARESAREGEKEDTKEEKKV